MVRRVIGSRSVTRASRAASTGATARMNRTRATLVWLSAAMKLPDAVATHSATPTPAAPTEPERLQHPAAFDDRDVGQQRRARERGPAEDLR